MLIAWRWSLMDKADVIVFPLIISGVPGETNQSHNVFVISGVVCPANRRRLPLFSECVCFVSRCVLNDTFSFGDARSPWLRCRCAVDVLERVSCWFFCLEWYLQTDVLGWVLLWQMTTEDYLPHQRHVCLPCIWQTTLSKEKNTFPWSPCGATATAVGPYVVGTGSDGNGKVQFWTTIPLTSSFPSNQMLIFLSRLDSFSCQANRR